MDGDIVEQGVELMLFGMGTVVIFLTLLILVTSTMSRVLGRYFPDEVDLPIISTGQTSPAVLSPPNQARHIAVITAAIHQHRANKK